VASANSYRLPSLSGNSRMQRFKSPRPPSVFSTSIQLPLSWPRAGSLANADVADKGFRGLLIERRGPFESSQTRRWRGVDSNFDPPRWEPSRCRSTSDFQRHGEAFRRVPPAAISIVNSTRSQGLTSRSRHGREEFWTQNRDRRRSRPYGGTLSGLGPPESGQSLKVGSA
jgi:hypothetical protein